MSKLHAAYATITKKLRREIVVRTLFFLPDQRKRELERWLRGREELHILRRCDVAIVSCGKSGRTWLRTLLSRFFQLRFHLAGHALINFDSHAYIRDGIPRLTFTHDAYLKYYTGNFASKSEYRDKPTVLMVRHPADVAVSQYHQWKHRILPRKKWLNEYPLHGSDIGLFDFVMHPNAGLPYVIEFLNCWNRDRHNIERLLLLRYEDLRTNPQEELRRLLCFLGFEPDAYELDESVQFGSFENMRKIETSNNSFLDGRKLRRVDGNDQDAFKVRRGKVGGWRDSFDADQVRRIEQLIDDRLEPGLGYRSEEILEASPAGFATGHGTGFPILQLPDSARSDVRPTLAEPSRPRIATSH